MAKAKDNSMHWIIGIVLLITGVLIIAALVVTYSQGQSDPGENANLPANVNIGNDAPIILTDGKIFTNVNSSGSEIFQEVTLGTSPGGIIGGFITTVLNINVTDANGFDNDTITVNARLVRTEDSGANVNWWDAGNDPLHPAVTNQAYALPKAGAVTCTAFSNFDAGTGANTGRGFRCPIDMYYVSDTTTAAAASGYDKTLEEWHWVIEADDGAAGVVFDDATDNYSDADYYMEYPALLGLSLDENSIEFGAATTDGIATGEQTVNFNNEGNQDMDVQIGATPGTWSCPSSVITPLVSDIHHTLTTGQNYNAMNPLATGLGTAEDANLVRSFDTGVTQTDQMYFSFATTQAVASGQCTLSNVVFTAALYNTLP